MILKQFKTAINAAVLDATERKIPIIDADLTAPIVRPSFKTFVDGGSAYRLNDACRCRSVDVDIWFFASDRNAPRLENMEITDVLTEVFDTGVMTDGAIIPPSEELEFETEDGVLHLSFSADIVETISDAGEPMEILKEGFDWQ